MVKEEKVLNEGGEREKMKIRFGKTLLLNHLLTEKVTQLKEENFVKSKKRQRKWSHTVWKRKLRRKSGRWRKFRKEKGGRERTLKEEKDM